MDFTQLSNKELSEAIDFHRRQRNMSRGVNESAHMRQTQVVRLLEAEESRRLEESEAAYKKADRDEKRKSGSGEYYVTNSDMKKTHSEPFKTSDAAISHANAQENKTGRIHTVHHIKNGKIQKQWQYSDSAGRFASYSDHAGQTTHIHEEVELDEVSASTLRNYIDKSRADKKAAMKDRTAAEKNVKKYGMASDKKERDDAARRVGNRNQGISVANKKLGTYPADKAKAKVMAREEVEQIDEISTELKKRYVEKGAEDVVDRFTGRGKYEKPRNPAHFTKTGRVKKSALNRPEAIKYREKLDNRRDIVNKVSQEVHGKKRFGEEVELDENIAGKFKDASEWEKAAKSRGLVVKSMTHPSGEMTKYQIAKDKEGNNRGHFDHGTKSGHLKEEVELDEAAKPNQYIEVVNKFTGSKSHHEVHPTKAFAALNHHNSLWNTKSARIVSGKEAESIKASKMKKEEVEQIDELSKKTLGSYIKKAKDDLGSRESEVTRNYYRDPRGVTDPIKHNNDLLRKRTSRRDNINKAVDKLTNEEHTNCGTPDCCGQCSTPVNEAVSANAMNPVQNKVSASLPKKGPQGAMLPFNRFRSANGGVNISAKNEEIEESAKSKMMAKLNKNVDPADYHSSADAQKHLHDIDQHQLKMK